MLSRNFRLEHISRIAFGTTLIMLLFVAGVSASDYDLTGNAQVLWNTTIQDRINFAYSPNIDFDMDGFKDIIVQSNGKIRLISGSNGAEKWMRKLGESNERAWSIEVDDFDGDGGNDIYEEKNSYYGFINGKTGTPLWNRSISLSPGDDFYINNVQGIGDISNDNKNDMVISSYFRTYSNGIYTDNITGVRGYDGHELWKRSYQSQPNGYIDAYPNVVDDISKDGKRDVLIRIYSYLNNGFEAVDGSTGTILWNLSKTYGDIYGESAYDDLSGDGHDDVILSSMGDTWAVRGNDGSMIWARNNSGYLLTTIQDINGDGKTDVVVGYRDSESSPAVLKAYSGTTGAIIWEEQLGVQGWPGGYSINDINGDGKRDLIIISRNETYDSITNNWYRNFTVQAISAANGNILWTQNYNNKYLNGWAWFEIAGDLTGDNKQDINLWIHYRISPLDNQYRLNTTALNAVNGNKLWEMNNITYDMVPDFLGDFNGDNKGEVLIYRNQYPGLASFGIQSAKIGSDIEERNRFANRQIEILNSHLKPEVKQQLIEGFINQNSVSTGKLSTESNIMSASGSNYARAFIGDNIDSTIWNISSNNNIWSVWSPRNIDMNADGITDKAITIGNTIYLLEKNVPVPPKSVSININNGIESTNSRSVVLTLSAENAVNMRFKNENSAWTNWEQYSSTKQWELSSGDGLKTVYLEVKNEVGTTGASDTILLDTNPPAVSFLNPTPANNTAKNGRTVEVNVSLSEPGVAILNWNGTNISSSGGLVSSWSYIVTNLIDGVHQFKVYAIDALNNIRTSETRIITIDNIAPIINKVFMNDTMLKSSDSFYIEVNATDELDNNLSVTVHVVNNTDVEIGSMPLNKVANEIYRLDGIVNDEVPEGTFKLNITASDDANNVASNNSVSVIVDKTKPAVTNLTLSQLTPKMNDPVNITADIEDMYLNASSIFVDVKHPGGYSFRSLMNGSEPNYYFNYTNTSEYGRYNVTIIASDEAGNINNTQKTWFVTIKTSSASLNEENGEIANGSWEWNSSNFQDFVYNENLKSNMEVGNRTIHEGGLWYNTSTKLIPYKVFDYTDNKVDYGLDKNGISQATGGGYYAVVGWMGKSYVAINGKANKHSTKLYEQNVNDTKNLTTGETWDLGSGYSLKFNSSDPNAYPIQIELILFKNGSILNYTIIEEGKVYSYYQTFGGENNVPLFVTYLDNVSASTDPITEKKSVNYITLKYTWLISDSVAIFMNGDKFGNMTVQDVNWSLNLSNDENMTLDKDSSVNIADDLYFRVLDTENLSYYPFFNRPEEAETIDLFDNDLSLDISVNESISGSVNVTQMSDVPPNMNSISGFKSLNKFIDIDVGDDIRNSLEWVKIKIYYTQAELDKSGVTEANLKILWYNGSVWQDVTGGYNSTNVGIYTGHVWTNMSHLSTFALAGYIPPSSGGGNPPSSGGGGSSSSGGGGGGGVSGENFSNIILKENYDLTISKDITTSYRFKSAGNPVTVVNITGNVSAGLINTAVEVLKGTSTLVKEAAPGTVYKNVNIWVGTSGFATSKNIKESIVVFKVENSWFDSNTIARSDIRLAKWDGAKWITLETSEKIRDSTYTYFEGKTTSFSPFAITGLGISSTSPSEATSTQNAQAGTPEAGAATTGGTTPPINLFSIIGVIAILVVIAAVYLKYKK